MCENDHILYLKEFVELAKDEENVNILLEYDIGKDLMNSLSSITIHDNFMKKCYNKFVSDSKLSIIKYI